MQNLLEKMKCKLRQFLQFLCDNDKKIKLEK